MIISCIARVTRISLMMGFLILKLILSRNSALANSDLQAMLSNGNLALNVQVQPTSTSIAYPDKDRYFPLGTPLDVIKAKATRLTKQQVKLLIEQEVSNHWTFLQTQLGFTTVSKAYAFFLGLATRESTFNAALETGSGPGHSYGALQAAETAYANANPNYSPENNVPEIYQYQFTPANFYDPRIAIHMGIRHLLHFVGMAKAGHYQGIELFRHALIGYNTGSIQTTDQNLIASYTDEIGALAGWYLQNGHLQDSIFTWTNDSRVNRSNAWGWY